MRQVPCPMRGVRSREISLRALVFETLNNKAYAEDVCPVDCTTTNVQLGTF